MTKEYKILAVTLFCSVTTAAHADELDAGRAIFAETSVPTCSVCHSLTDAGAAGEVGPNLDDFKPTFEQVRAAVTSGIGVMPAYGEILTADEIEAVSKYVAEVTGGANGAPAKKVDEGAEKEG